MIRLYAGLALILLLGAAFWYHGNQNYQSGVNAERTKWQDELLKTAQARAKAEKKSTEKRIEREVIYRDKIRTVYQASDACLDTPLPPGVLRPLCEVGLAPKDMCESNAIR